MSKQRERSSKGGEERRNDVFVRARSTLSSLGDAFKSLSAADTRDHKQKTGYFLKSKTKNRQPEYDPLQNRSPLLPRRLNASEDRPRPVSMSAISRQNSDYAGSFPGMSTVEHSSYWADGNEGDDAYLHTKIVLPVDGLQFDNINFDSPDRPRKKLSFRDPEISASYGKNDQTRRAKQHMGVSSLNRKTKPSRVNEIGRSSSANNLDLDLESQAMRIVRTVGQAFEVCHKLSLNSPPSPEPPPDLASTSDLSDINATKEGASGASGAAVAFSGSGGSAEASGSSASVGDISPASANGIAQVNGIESQRAQRPVRLDLLPPPPSTSATSRRSPQPSEPYLPSQTAGIETASEATTVAAGSAEMAADTPLSARHELQLLRERLEQQSQQTRAAVAQLLLLRDQLAAEQAARCEAQARTHQLLVHNKELLDHISALVAHLQEREKTGAGAHGHTPVSIQQLTMVPQASAMSLQGYYADYGNFNTLNDNRPSLANRVIDNAMYTDNMNSYFNSAPPKSPIRSNIQTNNNNFQMGVSNHSLSTPTSQANMFNFNMPLPDQNVPSQMINARPNFATFPNLDIQNSNHLISLPCREQQNLFMNQQQSVNQYDHFENRNLTPNTFANLNERFTNLNQSTPQNINELDSLFQQTNLSPMHHHFAPSPTKVLRAPLFPPSPSSNRTSTDVSQENVPYQSLNPPSPLIRPLSQAGTLTTLDNDGKIRVIVPVVKEETENEATAVPNERSDANNSNVDLSPLVTFRITDESGNTTRRGLPMSPPFITRTTSEKVPNRSEMMTQLRTQWTRHTTK